MSVWKKAAKAHQKTHKERHQPAQRQHLGILEKKRDYVRRAKDFNEKKQALKLLHKRALNKNPDEFYHHMINSKVENGKHFEKEKDIEDSVDQIKLMKTQDYKYIVTKRTQELRKIEKLQAQLHLSSVNHQVQNKHIYYNKEMEKNNKLKNKMERLLSAKELPDVNIDDLIEASKKKQKLYTELSRRIERENELTIVQQKIELQRALNCKSILPPKKIKKATKERAAVYKWRYERKK